MADKLNLLRKLSSLDVSPQFENYSKIIINIDDETQIVVGDDTGRTLEYTDPFGSREQAERQLAALRGYQYQPATAEGAILDPAAEIGDGVSAKKTYFGVYKRQRKFDRLMKADIAAPHDEEIDHEYHYENPTERKFKRQVGDVKATLLIQANRIDAEVQERTEMGNQLTAQLAIQSQEIAAKVSQSGGNNSTFGWSLLADRFSLYSGSKEVFRADKDGVSVSGKVNITGGTIGNSNTGFTITATSIYNGISQYGGNQSSGVYIGTNGIQLGSYDKGFHVDSAGNLYATNGTFKGNVSAGSIQFGNNYGYFNGGGISGGSIGTGQLNSYCSGGIGGGISFNACTSGYGYVADFHSSKLHAHQWLETPNAMVSTLSVGGRSANWITRTIAGETITYLG